MYVKTRNGLFADEGYGGGVFNGNTAFGAYDTPKSISGLGEIGEPGNHYPWMQFSVQTEALQREINARFNSPVLVNNPCPIDTDGILAGETCGALAFLNEDGAAPECLSRRGLYIPVKIPTAGNPCPPKFADYRRGDRCDAKHTKQNVQRFLGRTPDGVWGPLSQAAMDTFTRTDGATYCDLVPECTGPLPAGVVCPHASDPLPDMTPVPVPDTGPAVPVRPPPAPEEEDEEEPDTERKPGLSTAGVFIAVGGFLLLAGAAVVFSGKRS